MDVLKSTLVKLATFVFFLRLATHQDLVQKVLDKLLLERSRGQQAVEIGAQELGNEVAETF